MISEIALISGCDIILVDEIENAGIDRQKALELLVRAGKITITATHDPLLALKAQTRLVFSNGAVAAVKKTSLAEKKLLKQLEARDADLEDLKNAMRRGAPLHLL